MNAIELLEMNGLELLLGVRDLELLEMDDFALLTGGE